MGWKIYSVIVSFLLILSYIPFSGYRYRTIFDVLDMPITIITLVGLCGYAFKKTCLTKKFWRYWFFAAIIWHFLYFYYLRTALIFSSFKISRLPIFHFGRMSWSELAYFLFPTIFFIPIFIGLYLYAFRSGELWESKGE